MGSDGSSWIALPIFLPLLGGTLTFLFRQFNLAIGLTTGSGAIFLYYRGLTRVRAQVAAVCELCLPLSAVLFDYLINDSVLGAWQWLGAAILVAAILRITTLGSTSSPTRREA